MRPPVLAPALALAMAAAAMAPSAALADAVPGARSGGVAFGASLPPVDARPVAMRLAATPREITARDLPPAFTLLVRQRGTMRVRARIVLFRMPGNRPVARVDLGRVQTGTRLSATLPTTTRLQTGRYLARLHVTDPRGRTLLRSARYPGRTRIVVHRAPRVVAPAAVAPAPPTAIAPAAVPPVALWPPPAPSPGGPGVFPVVGAFGFGGAASRFGAGRDDHVHQGQDIAAAGGTPVVAPYAGTISSTSYQAAGAGEYVVLDGVDGRDYLLAHCLRSSTAVTRGAVVAAGQPLCQVGATGMIDGGAHLHFEIWTGGWSIAGGAPIDPLPELRAWARR